MERKNSTRYRTGKEAGPRTDGRLKAEEGLEKIDNKPRASRDVPVGERWTFSDHRTMAEVMRDELG
jgi:hypothetical protein